MELDINRTWVEREGGRNKESKHKIGGRRAVRRGSTGFNESTASLHREGLNGGGVKRKQTKTELRANGIGKSD